MPGTTAADVAIEAGVSRSAVSRAFRQDRSLSEDKRARILAAAKKLGYLPPSAQAVARLSDKTITLVAADMDNPFYPMAANALSQAIHASGRRLILHAVPPQEDVDSVLKQVLDYRSEAAIVTSSSMSSRMARDCRAQRMPVILFNRVQPDRHMTAVTCDNYGGGRLAAGAFVASGRHRIGMIGGKANTSTHIERKRGFIDRLAESDMRLWGERAGEFRYDVAFGAARDWLAQGDRPDALFCLNDVMALAALDAARVLGLRVPEDLAVIGFDDIQMAAWPSYGLTTVRQPLRRMVADTLELIEAQLSDPEVCGTIRIAPVRLVERDSA
ncbi:MAG: LacI family DNA-binding transcriptional regulator [Paracoccaceae bacterium]